ncbi:MAG: hypothetical protein KGK00_15750 [Paracoccaceae bacterium]|nr:hypothetical protein [Paracoccaceae bacterium]MDE3239308.1 hypothetical protein [Paracoccaceae bacterium]
MTHRPRRSIEEITDRTDRIIGAPTEALAASAPALADELLAMGEDVLDAWLIGKGQTPTAELSEGFRLLAQHRQAARGNPSFNACRETCRELVYHHNLIRLSPTGEDAPRNIRLGAMVLRHLALFVEGKLVADGLGDFCCSSRPIRQGEQAELKTEAL